MRRSKKQRVHSPERDKAGENEASSFDSGIDTSAHSSDNTDHVYLLAGRIESIHMINFMCHSNLEVTFKNRITFVTGQNGSGKSTIMAALIVVLGGTASTTGRGSGMADFIKKGETWGRVTVTLMNEGMNSYKKNIYGSRIRIIRDLSKQAVSTYTCQSLHGSIISKKKEEVDKICAALDIQIKNPICILNQDVARTFMSAADNSTRYIMFMKATHLEDLRTIYSDSMKSLNSSRQEIETKKLSLIEANKEIVELKKKLEYIASLEKYVNEKTSLENELVWSMVLSEEKDLEILREKKSKIEEKKRELEESESKFGEIVSELETEIKESEEKLSNLGMSGSGDKTKKRELEAEIQNLQRQIGVANSHMKQLIARSNRQQSDINGIKEHLNRSEEVASQSQEEKNKIKEKIGNLRITQSELRDRIETTQRDSENGTETKLQHTIALENLNSDLKDLERLKRNIEMQRERSVNVDEDPISKFGPFAKKLKELIEVAAKKNQFQKKPIGPCGMYVKLSEDPKWARAAESVVGGLMNTYCCDNQRDFQVLSRIMESVCGGKSPPVIISKFQNTRHNVSSKKVSVRGLNTVLDVLHISNDVVFNTFVDQARLETILLFETDAQASSLLSHIQNVPKNLRRGVTLQSDQYYPAPNYRTYCGDSSKPLRYFDAPVKGKAAEERLETEVKKTQLRIKEKSMEIAEVNEKLMKVIEFLRKTENKLRLLKENERKIESQISELKEEEDSKPVISTRVVLEEELAALEKIEEETQEKIEKDRKTMESLSKEKEERVQSLEEIARNERSVQGELSKVQERLDDLKYKLTIEKNKKKNLTNDYKEIESSLVKISDEISSRKESLKKKEKAATEVHEERIDTAKSPAEIQKLLEKCEKYLQAVEERLDSKETVIKEYKWKYQKYKSMKTEMDILERGVETLTKVALSKKERFTLLLNHTANLVSFHFQACLQTRGYDGQLKFDFRNNLLELVIIPKDGLVRKDTKTLSGGERSYSTVSFILAIWRAVQMPFYFLDEFDVFMDKVNRKVIMDLLLEHGRNEERKQFIFITPQDISAIRTSEIVSVYKMPDPRKTNE